MSQSLEEFAQDLAYGLTDIVLYIPRRIYGHFKHVQELERKNIELIKQITERDYMFKRINFECTRTSYGNDQARIRKIKELAETFPNDKD